MGGTGGLPGARRSPAPCVPRREEVMTPPPTAEAIKARARELGADLVGIADGKVMDAHPPDPRDPRRPSDVTALDAGRVIVMAKRVSAGSTRRSEERRVGKECER